MRRRRVEHRAQLIGNRDLQHRIDDMLLHLLARVLKGHTFQVLEARRVNLLDDEILQIAGHHPLAVGVVLEFRAASRIAQFRQPLLSGAQGRLAPGLGVIKQVPVRKGKGKTGGIGMSLRVDAQSPGMAVVEPCDQEPMDLRFAVECNERLVDQRAPAQFGERLESLSGRERDPPWPSTVA